MAYVLHKIEAAQAFDELSVLEIKKDQSQNPKQKQIFEKQIRILRKEINEQIGIRLFQKIKKSEFYSALFIANLKVFQYVGKSNWTKAAAYNKVRFQAKRELQRHFFGKELSETKI